MPDFGIEAVEERGHGDGGGFVEEDEVGPRVEVVFGSANGDCFGTTGLLHEVGGRFGSTDEVEDDVGSVVVALHQ